NIATMVERAAQHEPHEAERFVAVVLNGNQQDRTLSESCGQPGRCARLGYAVALPERCSDHHSRAWFDVGVGHLSNIHRTHRLRRFSFRKASNSDHHESESSVA